MVVAVELDDAVAVRVLHMVGEDDPAVRVVVLLQHLRHAGPVKDVVPQDQGDFVAAR